MSLALLEGYSSAEDDEPAGGAGLELSESGNSSAEEAGSDGDEASAPPKPASKPARRCPNPKVGDAGGGGDSSLPSALEAFADVSGPPDFLRHRVAEPEEATEALGVLNRRTKEGSKHPPPGAVVVAKPQLVAIRERVTTNPTGSVTSSSVDGKRVIGAANPGPEDAADLLRMCLQCGVPKTYSHARGMVCPQCGDRPAQTKESEKKKGSTVKDKEKIKRMRGQSSHASWKSETEMALRQQFD
ncbi:hypothetical protein PR202_ga02774 [Eleusine coracana subsp. coracana]|uniref:Uncharacterized protein n=1 Tax=Eleusine coracana subsp. coracana TaxID=191504 RepID=A0AAV5BME6_ELECO|nr:hypothetical protein QOZ80_2AG0146100 [Eleusine coracana subsp. coracana]GJM86875.1 hypothetical protein PR202_ga02774 [Eleusine coracana subsp. coracana]